MPERHLRPLSAAELRARRRRVSRIARQVGFLGRVEYRHAYSHTGGAQYGFAASPEEDLLVVYAEAFTRASTADDFSLEAMIAHERGHQLLARHPRLRRLTRPIVGWVTEEVLASLLGSLLVENVKDQKDLLLKAAAEATDRGMDPQRASLFLTRLREILEKYV